MDELIKAVSKPLYFFMIQNCCIIEALMMVILIDVKKKKSNSDLRHKLLRKLVVHFIFLIKCSLEVSSKMVKKNCRANITIDIDHRDATASKKGRVISRVCKHLGLP